MNTKRGLFFAFLCAAVVGATAFALVIASFARPDVFQSILLGRRGLGPSLAKGNIGGSDPAGAAEANPGGGAGGATGRVTTGGGAAGGSPGQRGAGRRSRGGARRVVGTNKARNR